MRELAGPAQILTIVAIILAIPSVFAEIQEGTPKRPAHRPPRARRSVRLNFLVKNQGIGRPLPRRVAMDRSGQAPTESDGGIPMRTRLFWGAAVAVALAAPQIEAQDQQRPTAATASRPARLLPISDSHPNAPDPVDDSRGCAPASGSCGEAGCPAPSASCGSCCPTAGSCYQSCTPSGPAACGRGYRTFGEARNDRWCNGFVTDRISPWAAQAGAVFMKRSTPASRPILSQSGGNQVVNTSDLSFDNEAGVDLRISRMLFLDCDLEIRYLGIDGWDASHVGTVTANGVGVFHDASGTASPALEIGDTATTELRSFLYSAEANVSYHICHGWSAVAGFRWAELEEDCISTFDYGTGTPASGRYRCDVNNHLYGFQFGGKGPIWQPGANLALEGFGKAGVFYNYADQTTLYEQPIDTSIFTAEGSDEHVGFMAEVGLSGVYRISDCWLIRGGYQVMWLDGVAVAANQLSAVDMSGGTGGIDVGGTVFYHGAMAAIEGRW
jgi:hypothetical protein